MRRRTLLKTGSLSIAVLALAACSSPQASENQAESSWSIPSTDPTTTITVLTYSPDTIYQPALEGFKKAHPTITVSLQTVPFENLSASINKEISSKDGDPDVYWMDSTQAAALAARGYTEDLTAQFSPYASRWDKAVVDNATVDGKLNSVPLRNSSQLLYYNKDLLDKAGIPYPSVDPSQRLTWEQVTDAAKKAVATGAANGLLFDQPDTYYQLEPLPVSLGGSPGATGKGNLTPDVASDAWIKGMTWYASIFKDGITPSDMPQGSVNPTFAAGKAAFLVSGDWSVSGANPKGAFNWGVAPMPYFEGGKPVTPTGSWNLAMNPTSKNKEAAAIFMKYMSVDGGVAKLPGIGASEADRQLAFQQPDWQSPVGKDAQRIVNYELQNTAVNRLGSVGYLEFENIINRTLSDIRNGADPKTALNSANDEIKRAWSKYQ